MFNPLPPEEIRKLRDETIGVICKNACNKTGSLYDREAKRFSDCPCLEEFRRRHSLGSSGIPRKYWDFDISLLLPSFEKQNNVALTLVRNYIAKLPEMVEHGVGLYIQGRSGLAKSAIAYYTLSQGLRYNLTIYGLRMSHLTKLVFDALDRSDARETLDWIRRDVQLLLIDEIDKEYNVQNMDKFAGARINEFFDDVYSSRKSLIVTSNLSKGDLSAVHAANVVDRLQELADIVLLGESYRKPDEALQKILGSS